MAKGGLGKGLDALLGDSSLQAQTGSGALSLPISQVQPKQDQPRKYFDDEALADLSDSIRLHGIIQPLTVRRLSSGYYQIIAGERRWRAAKLAGLKEVPAVLIEADDRKAAELAMIENLQREDLNPIEEANGYKVLMTDFGMTQDDVAQRLGRSRSSVANAMRLLDLPDPVRALIEENRISAGHARTLLALPEASQQRNVAQRIIDEGLSVRQTEDAVKRILRYMDEGEQAPKTKPDDPYQIYRKAAAEELSSRLGRKVDIVHGVRKGKVVLEYYDDNDLDVLLELLEQIKTGKEPKKGAKA